MTSHMDFDPSVTTSANTLPRQIPALPSLAPQPGGHTLPRIPLSEDDELDYKDSSSEREKAPNKLENEIDIEHENDIDATAGVNPSTHVPTIW